MILEDDLELVTAEVEKSIPFYEKLDEVRKAALVDMAYNMGTPRLLGFSKMLNAMANGDWETAAREARDSRWAKQTDRRGDAVVARPDRIIHMIRTGDWPDDIND